MINSKRKIKWKNWKFSQIQPSRKSFLVFGSCKSKKLLNCSIKHCSVIFKIITLRFVPTMEHNNIILLLQWWTTLVTARGGGLIMSWLWSWIYIYYVYGTRSKQNVTITISLIKSESFFFVDQQKPVVRRVCKDSRCDRGCAATMGQ